MKTSRQRRKEDADLRYGMNTPQRKAYKAPVTFTGYAIVYAYSEEDAREMLTDARVMIAGNTAVTESLDVDFAQIKKCY
ncbi:MAG: hypothetical protein A4E73_02410 [Syntrophaceae bacterium PtaU1.Bin231]|nr:MAG: hypothetical protein A4E73_02410 [Syntrophaceae bacterium PtaU1.Bin231]OQB40340.1 MAG: hypothetical protein BWY06_01229 [Candidatus Latescibacteria bacterium ADurb.Bin168]